MFDIIAAFAIGILVGICIVVVALLLWPPELEEYEEEFVRSGAPPDPNEELMKQLRRTRNLLEQYYHGSVSNESDALRVINQTKKVIRDHTKVD